VRLELVAPVAALLGALSRKLGSMRTMVPLQTRTCRTSALDSITGDLGQLVHQSSPHIRRRSGSVSFRCAIGIVRFPLWNVGFTPAQSVSLGRCPTHIRSTLAKDSMEVPGGV
ncbi:hypothetical protein C8R47DRAFT_1120766, partial [Mycena vitilis]